MPANNDKYIDNWTEKYLDDLELIYGPNEIHPIKTMEEINMEWLEAFLPIGQNVLFIEEWMESYLSTYAILYGALTLHAPMDIEELNQRWIDYFYKQSIDANNMQYAA